MKEVIKNNYNYAIGVYTFCFVIYSLVGRIYPLINIMSPINDIIYMGFAFFGMVLVLLTIVFDRYILKVKYSWLLLLFIGVTGISSLVNISYGFTGNVKALVWLVIHVFLYYTLYMRIEKEQLIRWIKITFVTMIVIWFVAIVISIGQYVFQIEYMLNVHGIDRRQGFTESRLFGVFNDPNYAAITSLYLCAASFWIVKGIAKRYAYVLAGVNAFFNYIYIILSGSRSGMLCMFIMVAVFAMCIFKNIFLKKSEKRAVRVAGILGMVCVSLVVLAGVNTIAKTVLPYAVVKQGGDDGGESEKDEIDEDILERTDTSSDDISNNRFQIWQGYMDSMEGKYLLGLSPGNFMDYIVKNYPDSYIAETMYETHNGYVTLYVSTGVVGVLVMLVFLLCVLKELAKEYFSSKQLSDGYIFVLMLLAGIFVNAMFFTELYFVNNMTTVILYTILGICLGKKEN